MLSIFRLHGPRCSAKKSKHDRTYRRCSCPIHVDGKCGDRFLRQSLHTTNWQRAQKLTVEAEARGSWDPLPERRAQAAPITIAPEATAQEFLKDAPRRVAWLSEATLRKYRLMFKHLEKFAAKKGFLYLKQLDLNALREFRESWELGPRTAMKKLERVKAFFRFATENEWITVNPARLLRGPANIRDTQKLPFEPAEIEKIFKACREVQIQGCANDELLAFTLVLRCSGLRIGDASMLTVDRFKGDDLYLYTQKSGTHVYVPLPPFVMNLVRAIKPKHGEYLFTGPESLRMETASDLWRRKLAMVFKAAEIPGGHPHRFRHTFAVFWRLYVGYTVLNESYASVDEEELGEGVRFRIYSKSRFIDFMSRATFASDEYPGPTRPTTASRVRIKHRSCSVSRCARNHETTLISSENRHAAMDAFHYAAGNPEGCVRALGS